MKILHVITGLKRGGAERCLHSLVIGDPENQHIIVSLTTLGHYGALFKEAGYSVRSLEMSGLVSCLIGFIELCKVIRKEKPAVVQSWMYHANLLAGVAAVLSRCKCVVWNIRMSDPQSKRYQASTRYVAKVGGLFSRMLSSAVVYCANAARDNHLAIGYENKNDVVICNGYDLQILNRNVATRNASRAELTLDENTLLMGAIGRYDPIKNHKGMLEAAHILKKDLPAGWKLILIGDDLDDLNQELVELINGFGLQQHVILRGAEQNIEEWHNAIDVLISFSIDEGFPNVVAEALACGTPAIVTDVGDSADIVGDTGWVIDSLNNRQLADAMKASASARADESWELRVQQCIGRATERYTIDAMVNNYNDVWKAALKRVTP